MFMMPEPWGICLGKRLTGYRSQPRGKKFDAVNQANTGVDLSTALTLDMEMQSFEFARLISCLALRITVM